MADIFFYQERIFLKNDIWDVASRQVTPYCSYAVPPPSAVMQVRVGTGMNVDYCKT